MPDHITASMARDLATAEQVCVRPILRTVHDRETGTDTVIAIACGSTREAACPSCAHKARVLRMQQCAEGWHRTDELLEQDHDATPTGKDEPATDESDFGERRVRSTRRRQDAPDLPRIPVEDRTVGRVFTAPNGQQYRPSMFLTLTLPGYGPVRNGIPARPTGYDYRRAALDALHFSKLVDRFWQNLRRVAGYKVQYFATVEPQQRLAPHLHAAIRGVIPRAVLRQVINATYLQLWWPAHDQPVYVHRQPEWTGAGYCDPDTGAMLPTWDQALDQIDADPDARPAHTLRFGRQYDMRGIIAPSPEADRAVRYLTKYLTKAISEPLNDAESTDLAREAHVDRLAEELRFLPCSPSCANWLRYGIQPDQAGPGLTAGHCDRKAHDRAHLGIGGRRVLVSRQWTGKTLGEHRADRAAVVRETLLAAGIAPPEIERLAAEVVAADGQPRYIWTDAERDPRMYARVILNAVDERRRWRDQYNASKITPRAGPPVDNPFGKQTAAA